MSTLSVGDLLSTSIESPIKVRVAMRFAKRLEQHEAWYYAERRRIYDPIPWCSEIRIVKVER